MNAVSFDLWGTLVDPGDRPAAHAWRLREFATVLDGLGHARPAGQLARAVDEEYAEAARRQRGGEQVAPAEQVAGICARLALPADASLSKLLTVVHTHAILRACPHVRPQVRTAIERIRERAMPVVLISNTLATSGEVTRILLDYLDITALFDEVFLSGEVGAAKPAPEIFHAAARHLALRPEQIVHVGDDWQSDVLGARGAGLRPLWLKPANQAAASGTPWTDDPEHIPDMLDDLFALAPGRGC